MLRTAFPGLGDVSSLRLSSLSVERVCGAARAALGAGGAAAAAALHKHNVCGLVLAVCRLEDLQPILDLPFGDWELFKLLILNLREIEAGLPSSTPAVTVITEKTVEVEPDAAKPPRPALEHQRSRPSNVEKQVTLEEQMICGALQTLNEEAMEDVLQSEPPSHPDDDSVRAGSAASAGGSPATSPRALRRDPSILKPGGSLRRRPPGDPPAVTFNVENEEDSDDSQITFSARPRRAAPAPRSRPSSLLVAADDAPDAGLAARSRSVEDSTRTGSPVVDPKLRGLRRTAEIIRKVSSAERLSRLRDKIMSRGGGSGGGGGGSRERSPARDASDDESAPLVGETPPAPASLSPRSDVTELESPREAGEAGAAFDLLPQGKGGGRRARPRLERAASDASVCEAAEPYNMRLLAHGTSENSRGLWRQDALDAGPPWPWDEPDSAV